VLGARVKIRMFSTVQWISLTPPAQRYAVPVGGGGGGAAEQMDVLPGVYPLASRVQPANVNTNDYEVLVRANPVFRFNL
jgi:hypothetical protein